MRTCGVREARLLPGRALARPTELPLAPPLGDALGVRAIGDGIARRGRRPDVRGPRRVKRIWRDATGLVRPAPLVLAAAAAAPAAGVAVRRHGGFVLHVDRSGDGERDYETFTGQTRRGLHHTQLGVSTSVLSHQGPGLTDSLVSLVL